MTNQERIAEQVDIARRLKDEGNDLLRSGDLQKAAAKYSKVMQAYDRKSFVDQ